MTDQPVGRMVCPFCGGVGKHLLDARDRNREITEEIFPYARCGACETVFMIDPPGDLGRYYGEVYYPFDQAGEPLWKTSVPLLRAASYRARLLREHAGAGRLIEIGAGTGAFASAARTAGFDVTAIEMSEHCCRYLREREGIEAICSDRPAAELASLPSARAIVMWHVLEHLANPAEILALAAEKLEPGGILAVAVPNPRSLQFRALGARWVHLDAPRHLCLMPASALIERGESLGLRLEATTTTDPDGLECDFFGWVCVLDRRAPVAGTPAAVGHAARALSRLLAPLERTGERGAAVTVLMRKEA